MASAEDGMEFRASDFDYDTVEAAFVDLPLCEEQWPDARFYIEEIRDKEYFMRLHQDRFDADEQDLY
jgi:hypothetical protein